MFHSQTPIVRLEALIQDPYDLAVSTARTCYSSKGIIRVEDVRKDEKARLLRDKIAASTLEAGHLTTRQHASFVFSIEKVSRHAVWSFLHSHPFYNSEQVSQRYVKIQPGNWAIPPLSEKAKNLYETALTHQIRDYEALIQSLIPEVTKRYYEIFPIRKKWDEKYKPIIAKKAYEVARYVLPIATHTALYHTINAVTLLRYHRLAAIWDAPLEQRLIVEKMVQEVLRFDPDFEKELQDPYPIEQTPEAQFFLTHRGDQNTTKLFIEDFDRQLDGKVSRLVDYKVAAVQTVSQAVRTILGQTTQELPNSVALDLLLNPQKNRYLSDNLNVHTLSKLSRAMVHAHYTFQKKLSHCADSQDQRHRMTPASRPILHTHYTGNADYVVPPLVAANTQILDRYQRSMQNLFVKIEQLLSENASMESALYLLPNAFPIRFEESGDLLNLHHKWHTRVCYTAQEEIFHASVQELQAVSRVHPEFTNYLLAPCFIRKAAGVKPICPEGERFCGVKVWEKEIGDYQREL